jgi:adenine-specific DNA-methyltransferase
MRYIGSKENLLQFIDHTVSSYGIKHGVFCDLFAGTTTVGRYFKRKGFQIISNDLMEYSYVFSKAYIENNTAPQFSSLKVPQCFDSVYLFELETERLEQIITYLNNLPGEHGFMFENYCDEGTKTAEFQRMYFSASNASKIDAIRDQIERWRQEQIITENEFYILLASLLEAMPSVSNTTGTYGAFLKYWEARSQKVLSLSIPPLVYSEKTHIASRQDANALIRQIECDVLYLDPPYNSRQYATNYHILETVARWDYPDIYGKSGLRPYEDEKSVYCQKATALQALQDLVCHARCKLFLLSYNSEGIMPHDSICDVLKARGKVTVREQPYRRFRSDSDHAKRQYLPDKQIIERIYVVEMDKEPM